VPGRRIILLDMATEDAELFVHAMQRGEMYVQATDSRDPLDGMQVTGTVEAVVARPTRYCQCNVQSESTGSRRRRMARRESGWSRGATFGWWCCAQCRKPGRATVTHWITTMLAGANDLLPKILGTGDPVAPQQRWEDEGAVKQVGALTRPGLTDDHANRPGSLAFTPVETRRTRKKDAGRTKRQNPRRGNVPH
jgi:hypothetical protein